MTLRTLIEEAKKLPTDEKAELLDELICMVGSERDVALTDSQRVDLRRRIEEYRSGKASLIPGDEAIARARKRD